MTVWRRSTATEGRPSAVPAGSPAAGPAAPPPRPIPIRTPAGRLAVLSCAVVLLLWVAQQVVDLPPALQLLRKAAALALLVSGAWMIGLLVAQNHRRLLWRVRRKLLLSYLFLSVVPIVLVLTFALAGAVVLYDTLTAYLLRQGIDEVVWEVRTIADSAAEEIDLNPAAAAEMVSARYEHWSSRFPGLSIAIVPVGGAGRGDLPRAGPWKGMMPPRQAPAWLGRPLRFGGIVQAATDRQDGSNGDLGLIVRAAEPTRAGARLVVIDVPLGRDLVARLEERTGVRIVAAGLGATVLTAGSGAGDRDTGGATMLSPAAGSPFQETVAFLDVTDWETGRTQPASLRLDAPVGRLSQRIVAIRSAELGSNVKGLVLFLLVLAVLFAIVQGSALVMGGALARSITYAVHELFVGTERVREGDFTHRIRVYSEDQLGDLADSFNRMSGSIEHLLHVQREKQRLDDELRIAREIQKSLLPIQPPVMPGLALADLCEPAREVGGDYYDFFELGPGRLGVLVADVSGKGTSAALYMAELKGLMLALSRTETSPRRLLTAVNHLLAAHLDNRSFVTAVYAVVDLQEMTLTFSRAGHTPIMVVSRGREEVLLPGGMVLGLRIPGASERFEKLLEEYTRPLTPGDVIVLYTDGITEAMDFEGNLFGEEALARVLRASHTQDPAAIRERVIRDVRAFVGDAEPHDDMTMVVIKVEGRA